MTAPRQWRRSPTAVPPATPSPPMRPDRRWPGSLAHALKCGLTHRAVGGASHTPRGIPSLRATAKAHFSHDGVSGAGSSSNRGKLPLALWADDFKISASGGIALGTVRSLHGANRQAALRAPPFARGLVLAATQ